MQTSLGFDQVAGIGATVILDAAVLFVIFSLGRVRGPARGPGLFFRPASRAPCSYGDA